MMEPLPDGSDVLEELPVVRLWCCRTGQCDFKLAHKRYHEHDTEQRSCQRFGYHTRAWIVNETSREAQSPSHSTAASAPSEADDQDSTASDASDQEQPGPSPHPTEAASATASVSQSAWCPRDVATYVRRIGNGEQFEDEDIAGPLAYLVQEHNDRARGGDEVAVVVRCEHPQFLKTLESRAEKRQAALQTSIPAAADSLAGVAYNIVPIWCKENGRWFVVIVCHSAENYHLALVFNASTSDYIYKKQIELLREDYQKCLQSKYFGTWYVHAKQQEYWPDRVVGSAQDSGAILLGYVKQFLKDPKEAMHAIIPTLGSGLTENIEPEAIRDELLSISAPEYYSIRKEYKGMTRENSPRVERESTPLSFAESEIGDIFSRLRRFKLLMARLEKAYPTVYHVLRQDFPYDPILKRRGLDCHALLDSAIQASDWHSGHNASSSSHVEPSRPRSSSNEAAAQNTTLGNAERSNAVIGNGVPANEAPTDEASTNGASTNQVPSTDVPTNEAPANGDLLNGRRPQTQASSSYELRDARRPDPIYVSDSSSPEPATGGVQGTYPDVFRERRFVLVRPSSHDSSTPSLRSGLRRKRESSPGSDASEQSARRRQVHFEEQGPAETD